MVVCAPAERTLVLARRASSILPTEGKGVGPMQLTIQRSQVQAIHASTDYTSGEPYQAVQHDYAEAVAWFGVSAFASGAAGHSTVG